MILHRGSIIYSAFLLSWGINCSIFINLCFGEYEQLFNQQVHDSQPRAILPPRRHLAVSRDNLDSHEREEERYWYLLVEARDAANHSTMPQDGPQIIENYPALWYRRHEA